MVDGALVQVRIFGGIFLKKSAALTSVKEVMPRKIELIFLKILVKKVLERIAENKVGFFEKRSTASSSTALVQLNQKVNEAREYDARSPDILDIGRPVPNN